MSRDSDNSEAAQRWSDRHVRLSPPMTPDVSADATQAARERLESAADNPTNHVVSTMTEDQTWLTEVDCDDVRTILTALTAAEGARDENEGVFKVWRRRCQEAEAQRDAALAVAGELTRPITTQDVRLAAGEGKLRPEHVFAGCNAELRRRAAALVAKADEPT